MARILSTNRIVNSPAYTKILHLYNEELKDKGKVNKLAFYKNVVQKEIPNYTMSAWYQFVRRFETEAGLMAEQIHKIEQSTNPAVAENGVMRTLVGNKEATAKALQLALNIGMERLQKILENPDLMTAKEAADLIFKVLKAQDSRIHAIGKVREDNREEEKMNRAFSDAAFSDNVPA